VKKYIYVSLLAFVLLLSACSKNNQKGDDKEEQNKKVTSIKKKSDTITLTSVDGEKIDVLKTDKGFTFSNTKNEAVLVSFFATWCPPCKAEIPHLNNLQEKYKDKLKIIGILIESNKNNDELKTFMNHNAINYTITNSPANQSFANAVGGVQSIPFMILYDKKGNYVTHYLGAIPEEMIDSDIQMALKK